MKLLLKSKKLITAICIISIVSLAISCLTAFAKNNQSIKRNTFHTKNGEVISLTQSETDDLINITASEAEGIAMLFVQDSAASDNVSWDENTEVTNVVPMYDETDSNTVTAYTVELDEGYVVVSAYLDAASLIPEWSDQCEPLYNQFNLNNTDKIVYLGGYDYYLDEGESEVTGLYDNQVEKNQLENSIEENRNVNNIPDSALLSYSSSQVSTYSVIVDPLGHANANYVGPFDYVYEIDRWTNYMDYYDTSYGLANGYNNHCGPTAITNLTAAFRNRYPSLATGIPTNNDSLFCNIANIGISNGYFGNSWGTNYYANNYIQSVFNAYGINPIDTYEIDSISGVDEFYFPMQYDYIYYVSLNNHPTYGNHAVIAYGISRLVSETTGSYKTYLHIADGWGVSPRYLDLATALGKYAVGVEFCY